MASTCTAEILDRLNNSSTFSTWRNQTTTALNNITTETPTTNTQLQNIETQITNTLSCAQERLNTLSNTPSSITRLTSDLTAARAELDAAKQTAQIAKERSQLITNPEKRTSVYEGWFPIFRPLQLTSMLVLLGLALFFTSFSLGILTQLMGFQIQLGYAVPFVQTPGSTGGFLSPLVLGLSAVVLVLVGLIIYAFTRKA
jgi:outer membrane murein-binding lipoprotein Lpp